MRNDTDTLDAVLAGFYGHECTGVWSSANWLAYQAGVALRGGKRPTKAHMSRGYAVKVETAAGEQLAKFFGNKLECVELQLIQAKG